MVGTITASPIPTTRIQIRTLPRAAQSARDQAQARREAQLEAQLRGSDLAPTSSKPSPNRAGGVTRSTQAASVEKPMLKDFSAHGLANEQILVSMYAGDFDKIQFERDDLKFEAMIGGYMSSY